MVNMVLLTLFEADYFTTYLRHVGVIYDYISISDSLGTLGQYTCIQANFSSRIRILGFSEALEVISKVQEHILIKNP